MLGAFAKSDSLLETIISKRAGYWLVSKSITRYAVNCSAGIGVWYFIGIDNMPLRSSVILAEEGIINRRVFSGISKTVIPAGEHTLRISAQCRSGNYQGSGSNNIGTSTVIVMPK